MSDETTSTDASKTADATTAATGATQTATETATAAATSKTATETGTTTAATATATTATETKTAEPIKGDWPEDWREKMADGDDKLLESLKRFSSPKALRDSWLEQRKTISQRTAKPKLPENATEEQIKAYRAEVGVPETPDKYDVALGDGHVWGDADKPLLESFTKAAHDKNIPSEYVKPILQWYDQLQQQQAERRTLADAQFKKDSLDTLAGEWGSSLGMEARIADEFMQSMGEEMYERFREARDPDGKLLFADAGFIRWANKMQRELNPAATVLPGSGLGSADAMASEISTIESLMGDRESKYWKGPEANKMQARYRDLIGARDRMGKKAA